MYTYTDRSITLGSLEVDFLLILNVKSLFTLRSNLVYHGRRASSEVVLARAVVVIDAASTTVAVALVGSPEWRFSPRLIPKLAST